MGSNRKQEANQRNAQKSTGPRSPVGRARASRNALKHGLAAAGRFSVRDGLVAELARDLLVELETSQEAAPELHSIVEVEIELLQARQVRTVLLQRLQATINDGSRDNNTTSLLDQLTRVDRYERRAFSRRKFAIRDLVRLLRHPGATSAGNFMTPVSNRKAS
jgi:hypothetical protein